MNDEIAESDGDEIEFRISWIIWSTVWVVVCVFVLGLWARSYSYDDRCFLEIVESGVSFESNIGQVHFDAFSGNGEHGAVLPVNWGLESTAAAASAQFGDDQIWAFEVEGINSWTIHAPHWFGALLSAGLAVLPWIALVVARGIKWIWGRRLARGGGGKGR